MSLEEHDKEIDLCGVLTSLIEQISLKKTCCDKDLVFEDLEEHCIILNFSGKITVNICDRKTNSGVQLSYRSHIQTKSDFEKQISFAITDKSTLKRILLYTDPTLEAMKV